MNTIAENYKALVHFTLHEMEHCITIKIYFTHANEINLFLLETAGIEIILNENILRTVAIYLK